MSNDKVKTIIDRSLVHTLDMSYCEDLMDWENLESALNKIDFEVSPDQFTFYIGGQPRSTKIIPLNSESQIVDWIEKEKDRISKDYPNHKINFYIRRLRRCYPRVGDSPKVSIEHKPIILEYALEIEK